MLRKHRGLAQLLSQHASVQILTQAFAFLSGILIVRSLDKTDYAAYAICIALISAIAAVAEGGLNSTLMSIGGRIRENRPKFAELYASVLKYRVILGLPFIGIGAASVAFLLYQNGITWPRILVVLVFTTLSIWMSLHSGTLYTLLRLDYKFRLIRTLNLLAALARFLLVALLLWADLGGMEIMLAVGLIILFTTNRILVQRIRKSTPNVKPNMDTYRPIFRQAALRVMPMNMAMILAEQSILFILTIYGATSSIAEVQALSRFGAAFVVINSLVIDLAAPYVARLSTGPKVWYAGFMPVLSGYGFICAVIIALAFAYSDMLLQMLGGQYTGLNRPLIIILCGLALTQFSHAFGVLNQARGWLQYSWVYLIFIPCWAIGGIAFLDLGSTAGAAVFMATQPIPLLITQIIRFLGGYRLQKKSV